MSTLVPRPPAGPVTSAEPIICLQSYPLIVETSEYTGRLARKLFGGSETDRLEKSLARGAIGSFALKISLTGFSFLISLILARSLGAAEYGVYVFILAWINFLCILVLAGLDNVVIREVAAGQAQSAWGVVRGLLRWSNRVVLVLSVIVGLLASITAWGFARKVNWPQLPAFLIALTLLPLLALTRVRQAAMQGLHHVVAGQLPEAVIQPAIFIGLILASHSLLGWALQARTAFALYGIATGTALLVGVAVLHLGLPQASKLATPIYRQKAWISSALPLLLVNGVNVLNTQAPILLLGSMKGAQTAGVYAIASRLADLIAFGLISVNLALAPVAARLWARRDIARLQQIVTRSVRAGLIFTVPVAVILIFFGEKLLSVFGPEFPRGQPALVILVIGQIVNVGMGPVALLLIMTGHEREFAIATGVCAFVNIALNLTLIHSWGLAGSAVAVTISIIIWNMVMAVCVKRRLGIHATAVGAVTERNQG
jgi:O-antigen/teichoic acid export membrane protein